MWVCRPAPGSHLGAGRAMTGGGCAGALCACWALRWLSPRPRLGDGVPWTLSARRRLVVAMVEAARSRQVCGVIARAIGLVEVDVRFTDVRRVVVGPCLL